MTAVEDILRARRARLQGARAVQTSDRGNQVVRTGGSARRSRRWGKHSAPRRRDDAFGTLKGLHLARRRCDVTPLPPDREEQSALAPERAHPPDLCEPAFEPPVVLELPASIVDRQHCRQSVVTCVLRTQHQSLPYRKFRRRVRVSARFIHEGSVTNREVERALFTGAPGVGHSHQGPPDAIPRVA